MEKAFRHLSNVIYVTFAARAVEPGLHPPGSERKVGDVVIVGLTSEEILEVTLEEFSGQILVGTVIKGSTYDVRPGNRVTFPDC